jgi:hypothetical protein
MESKGSTTTTTIITTSTSNGAPSVVPVVVSTTDSSSHANHRGFASMRRGIAGGGRRVPRTAPGAPSSWSDTASGATAQRSAMMDLAAHLTKDHNENTIPEFGTAAMDQMVGPPPKLNQFKNALNDEDADSEATDESDDDDDDNGKKKKKKKKKKERKAPKKPATPKVMSQGGILPTSDDLVKARVDGILLFLSLV